MPSHAPSLAGAAFALLILVAPARAWVVEDDGESWPIFSFHRYGGDVNRPGATPDRPYWHGDDAVPLGLRWRDGEATVAAEAAAAGEVAILAPAPYPVGIGRSRRVHRVVHRRPHHRAAPVCVPAKVLAPHP
ncbi:hypothetical protein P7D22_22190 [Lichenihabitans sp. Uapishka_5]|uniref:hypothetical protein n=1 Tax=Lichenihabitans sp. Uapishka_5 TaxID=3037302 RepID=UPI0029E7E380|nr:hypothetical protein [Lichenihabitans sp. Uapishka_5]MDX7953869.1 hypothetical protein [Lichenihabitans sp. Uapishka_5]